MTVEQIESILSRYTVMHSPVAGFIRYPAEYSAHRPSWALAEEIGEAMSVEYPTVRKFYVYTKDRAEPFEFDADTMTKSGEWDEFTYYSLNGDLVFYARSGAIDAVEVEQ